MQEDDKWQDDEEYDRKNQLHNGARERVPPSGVGQAVCVAQDALGKFSNVSKLMLSAMDLDAVL